MNTMNIIKEVSAGFMSYKAKQTRQLASKAFTFKLHIGGDFRGLTFIATFTF